MGNQNKYKSGSIFDMQFITSSISTTLVLLLPGRWPGSMLWEGKNAAVQ